MLDCDLAKLYQVETGVFATRWVGVDWSFKEMPQNQHLMGNAVFVNPPKTHTDPLRTCTDLQNCRQRFQGIWGVFSSKIAHLHRSWNAVFARYLRLFAGASCVSRGQKCATKTVVKLSSKLSSNQKLKPCDAVIARAAAIYFAGARGWTLKSL